MIENRFVQWSVCVAVLLLVSVSSLAQSTEPQRGAKDRDGTIVVPAGTEIKVELLQPRNEMKPPFTASGKVIVPVRIGFATPISASSRVTVGITPVDQTSTIINNTQRPRQRYIVNMAELISITTGDVTYPVKTDTVTLSSAPGLNTEVTFVLTEGLHVATGTR